MGHDLRNAPVIKLENIVNHLFFALFNLPFFAAHIHHHADFLFSGLPRFKRLGTADQSGEQLGKRAVERDKRPEKQGNNPAESGERGRNRLWVTAGDPVGKQQAEHVQDQHLHRTGEKNRCVSQENRGAIHREKRRQAARQIRPEQ